MASNNYTKLSKDCLVVWRHFAHCTNTISAQIPLCCFNVIAVRGTYKATKLKENCRRSEVSKISKKREDWDVPCVFGIIAWVCRYRFLVWVTWNKAANTWECESCYATTRAWSICYLFLAFIVMVYEYYVYQMFHAAMNNLATREYRVRAIRWTYFVMHRKLLRTSKNPFKPISD